MKRFLLFVSMLFISLGIFAQYVDLGLPSGTKWKSFNEPDFYSYGEAISKFTDQLPTKDQWRELYDVCDWIWLGSAYKVIGPNGNSIYFPATGARDCNGNVDLVGSDGCYWSSMPKGSDAAYSLGFNSDYVNAYPTYRCRGLSVRLVASSPTKYVDLGLPSGTLWRNGNEGGDYARYTYDDAVSNFGNKLPTKEQLQELIDNCTWTWTGSGYKVVGPNGNSIYFPAAGNQDCDDNGNGDVYGVGSGGSFWSSTPHGSVLAYDLGFDSDRVNMCFNPRCYGLSVRLVQH